MTDDPRKGLTADGHAPDPWLVERMESEEETEREELDVEANIEAIKEILTLQNKAINEIVKAQRDVYDSLFKIIRILSHEIKELSDNVEFLNKRSRMS